ncbi:DEAD/DEAH box helicase [Alteriqipengyuania lutimaris]|uniref:ATP-dependent helicase n=1 Tax=Alteriqipengyuania lutimaris TaxID=1538146 RepID=A0A395LPB1_9SPHN|nr:DEAD/DEAH box helicase [Alteriqipengyuania lutimaris]MBB3032613.1 ATP-dependent RNA helicase DeaD [Alteriqipengyuania lutimaris]RDS78267.1 ATP-dependent helicase [Alteriqipengyuania lutimaris]
MNFSDLPDTLQTALTERGYSEPTDVQAAVLEPEANGRDLVVSAQTGSGKTVAFGLAVARQLLDDNGKVPFAIAPLALVITPTRELALQVSRELTWLYAPAGGRVATCVGGMNPSAERKTLRSGATIVVGTPGRLRDHLERGALDLSALKAVTLDEADEMLDMGFREELETILDATPEGRRTLLFSATMPKPIEALARRYQSNALRISTVSADRGHGDISYEAVVVSPPEVENAVVNLLRFHEAETAILFCGTREKVRHLHATLQERGFAVVSLSGENSQSERNQALQALRDRRARVCVATDVAARGIDLPTLSLVVHVEIPRDAETLQHRSGRTGRAGRKGTAVLVVPFSRRRRVEQMLRNAKIDAKWTDAPDREAIRAKDRDRLMQTLLTAVEPDEGDSDLVDALLAQRTPRELASMLVASHRAKMPEPEDLIANTPEARRNAKAEKHRPGFEDTVWFKMDIGRRRNADPRWILPLLCRRGHITRNEVGAIRIGPDETYFQIPRAIADKFSAALARTAGDGNDGDEVRIEASATAPRDAARANRKSPPPGRRDGRPKPHRKNNDAGARPGPKGKGPPKKAKNKHD